MAMNNQDIFDLINYITGLSDKQITIEGFQFDLLLKRNSWMRYKQMLGLPEGFYNNQPTTGRAFEVMQRSTGVARRFKISGTLAITNTLATIPANYFYVTGINNGNEPVDIVTDGQWGPRISNSITYPEDDYPICRFFSAEIQFLPSTVSSVSWTYLRKPTPPVYVTKFENGITVYDAASSTELDWGETEVQDIIALILSDVGVPMDPTSIESYAQLKNQQGA